jgi:putative transposase
MPFLRISLATLLRLTLTKQQVILLHSDQGSTYRAYDYLGLFKVNNITQSMSKKGECYDNAVAERFFNTK